jgi:nitroreductase/NAD-dependent dihydropyrimidine dehydrogenase PreA subunit
MSLLTINSATCKQCGICVQACPALIIAMGAEDNLPFVSAEKEALCILCGHCEAVCPDGALTHNLLTAAETILPETAEVNRTNLSAYFRNRRSIRAYRSKPVDKQLLEQVMDVVRYAPTASNRQLNKWVIVQDKATVTKITEETVNWMQSVVDTNPEVAKRMKLIGLIAAYKKGTDRISRNAPHLVIGYGDANYSWGIQDSMIAATHLELLLPSFGLGGCWGGYLMGAFQQSPALKKLIGLDDSSVVHSVLMVGYPKYRYYKIPPRKESQVNWL